MFCKTLTKIINAFEENKEGSGLSCSRMSNDRASEREKMGLLRVMGEMWMQRVNVCLLPPVPSVQAL